MASKRHRRSRRHSPSLSDLHVEAGSQGGPLSLEESEPVQETTKPEVMMENQEMEDTKQKAAEAAEDLAERAGVNKEQLRGAAREWGGKAERAYGQVKSKVSAAAEELGNRYGDMSEAAANSWERTMELVQDNPGAAIGISLLVGAGLGALIAYFSRD